MANEKSVMVVIRVARPSFKINHDKFAFAVHVAFLTSGYALTATGSLSESVTLSALSTYESWNEVDGKYAFVYVNLDKEGKRMIMKCLAMNGKLTVSAMPDGLSELVNLEMNIVNYVMENEYTNYSKQYRNLDKLVKKLDEEILSKLDGPSTSSLKASSSYNYHGGRKHPICSINIGELIQKHVKEIRIRPQMVNERGHILRLKRRQFRNQNWSLRDRKFDQPSMDVIVHAIHSTRLGEKSSTHQPKFLGYIKTPRHKRVINDAVNRVVRAAKLLEKILESLQSHLPKAIKV
ncbi:hypothetical protein SADUNF_Sadunf14G0134100 [Salix dunnii]|uniref:PI31 proteasome regulator N-terminal domain-containing protein n=1 Tax=Salix dunnii TaxID=1413687 RepID=A0A835MQH9_9ROSI|nr:hypothetical protein SADUNF_Sadunf14G0134100 [Salix dunnii]